MCIYNVTNSFPFPSSFSSTNQSFLLLLITRLSCNLNPNLSLILLHCKTPGSDYLNVLHLTENSTVGYLVFRRACISGKIVTMALGRPTLNISQAAASAKYKITNTSCLSGEVKNPRPPSPSSLLIPNLPISTTPSFSPLALNLHPPIHQPPLPPPPVLSYIHNGSTGPRPYAYIYKK